jgi:arginine decarboxylase
MKSRSSYSAFTQNLEKTSSQKTARTHTPIHGGENHFLPFSYNKLFNKDFSEITGLDDLHNPKSIIYQAQNKAAELFQVEETLFSVNGASACLMACFLALGQSGKVLIPRNAHKSMISGLILSGLDPIFVEPAWDKDWGVFREIKPDLILNLIKKHKDNNLKACFLTSPTYEGIALKNLSQIIEVCHEHELPVIVDESHGGHLSLLQRKFSAIHCGADLIIHSAHKTLGSLTQTGLLHFQSELINLPKLKTSLSLLQSTSPSYLLLASLIESLHSLSQSLKPLEEQQKMALHLKAELSQIQNVKLLPNDDAVRCAFKIENCNGYELSEWLYRNYKLESELENNKWLMLLVSLAAKKSDIRYIKKAILSAAKFFSTQRNNQILAEEKPPNFHCIENPRNAFFRSDKAKIIFKCPPGIPIDFPGLEKLSAETKQQAESLKEDPFLKEEFGDDEEELALISAFDSYKEE